MMDSVANAIVAEGLSKSFGRVRAVAGIDFAVREGEIFGFLGPNGAGKTTTINLLTGLARADAGSAWIGGVDITKDPKAAQRLIGVVPDESNLYPELTGLDNLCFCASLYGLRKAERRLRAGRLLEEFGLDEAADRKFGGYSRGMKRKLAIAAGLIHGPQILFLDEPTTGLDVASARQIRLLIAGRGASGTTIFLTTHYIEEAERLCGRVAFLVAGRIVRLDTLENLVRPEHERPAVEIAFAGAVPGLAARSAAAFPALAFEETGPGAWRIRGAAAIPVGALVRFYEDLGLEVAEVRRLRPSLEDVFVRITGIETEAMRKDWERAGGGA
jgi:ABC-2 type transport system ATP-binding protein